MPNTPPVGVPVLSQKVASTGKKVSSLKQPEVEPAPTAPFPIGAKLRYIGNRRAFAGYNSLPIIEPSMVVTISDVAGTYSVFGVVAEGLTYLQCIGPDSKAEWVLA